MMLVTLQSDDIMTFAELKFSQEKWRKCKFDVSQNDVKLDITRITTISYTVFPVINKPTCSIHKKVISKVNPPILWSIAVEVESSCDHPCAVDLTASNFTS